MCQALPGNQEKISVYLFLLAGLPFWKDVETLLKVTSGGKSHCVDVLENGEILGVAVGGVREAAFGYDYKTEWGSRTGFAKVALAAGRYAIDLHKQIKELSQ